jgi:polygalacturonase
MIRINTILLTVALGLIMGATALQATNIQITYLPYTISAPGTYVLTGNLTTDMSYPSSQGAAITILKNIPGPVVLDFEGHAITWTGTTGTSYGVFIGIVGPSVVNTYPITISNGTINGFAISIDGDSGPITRLTVENMRFSNMNEGVKIRYTSYANVDNCVFTLAQYGIDDYSTEANNSYLNNTFNHVGYPILISDADYPLPTVIIPKVTTLP